eukprot:scaffold16.g5.t1
MPMQNRLNLFPLKHVKIVHLIRHSQGFHNVAGEADPAAYKSHDHLDAHLTDLGWRQAHALGRHIHAMGAAFRADVVVVSPLTRTLETAAAAFGRGPWAPGQDGSTALMLPQEAVPGRRAAQAGISAAGCPPLVAWEGCREHLGEHPCDKRRRISEISPSFPAVDFGLIGKLAAQTAMHIEVAADAGAEQTADAGAEQLTSSQSLHMLSADSDEDALWLPDSRETKEAIKLRGLIFMQACIGGKGGAPGCRERLLPTHLSAWCLLQWLMQRPEQFIAVVAHSGFLWHCMSNFGHSAAPTVQGDLHKWQVAGWANAEMRTVVLADEGGSTSHDDPSHFRGGMHMIDS